MLDANFLYNPPGCGLHCHAAGELSYPSFVPGADGTLHGLYTYNRRLIKYVRLDAGWVG